MLQRVSAPPKGVARLPEFDMLYDGLNLTLHPRCALFPLT